MNKGSQSTITNPCVRHCCLNEQDVCLGCFRSLSEITGWSKLDESQRTAVLGQAKQRHELHQIRYQSNAEVVWLKTANR